MLIKIIKFLKKFLLSFFILYGYNILVPSNAIIPLNIITVLIITFLNMPGLIILIIIRLLL